KARHAPCGEFGRAVCADSATLIGEIAERRPRSAERSLRSGPRFALRALRCLPPTFQISEPRGIIRSMRNGFRQDLQRFGPEGSGTSVHLAEARSYCSQLARTHYENFTVASLLLPRRLLRHFHAVYAYCRWADDLADEVGGGPRALALLRWWREELLRCY